jgi:hypothetical protein
MFQQTKSLFLSLFLTSLISFLVNMTPKHDYHLVISSNSYQEGSDFLNTVQPTPFHFLDFSQFQAHLKISVSPPSSSLFHSNVEKNLYLSTPPPSFSRMPTTSEVDTEMQKADCISEFLSFLSFSSFSASS